MRAYMVNQLAAAGKSSRKPAPPAREALGLTEDSVAFQELWSKLRWALGTTLQQSYGKRSPLGELASRLALDALKSIDLDQPMVQV